MNYTTVMVIYESQESSSNLAFRKAMSPVTEPLLYKYV